MSQNVNFMSKQPQTTGKKQGFIGALVQTGMTALPGAVIGGAAGGVLSLLPPTKGAVKRQISDLFESEIRNNTQSKGMRSLLDSMGVSSIINPLRNNISPLESKLSALIDPQTKKIPKAFKDQATKIAEKIEEISNNGFKKFYETVSKNSEFLKQAKKEAKKANRVSLIKNGALLGVISILLVSLIQSKKNSKESKE